MSVQRLQPGRCATHTVQAALSKGHSEVMLLQRLSEHPAFATTACASAACACVAAPDMFWFCTEAATEAAGNISAAGN